MLTARQKYDYRDINPTEARLISIGHAIWRLYLREKRSPGTTHCEETALLAACRTVWALKKQLRARLKLERAEEFAQNKHKFARLPHDCKFQLR